MNSLRNTIIVAALSWGGLAAVAGSTALADGEVNVSLGLTEGGKGLAARGYDVVAYFTDGKPVLGNENFVATHGEATYRFATQEHLDSFKANPEKYVPQYGGYCAFGCFIGKKADGDPMLWKIVDGKLYFNLNAAIQKKWSDDTAAKINKADENWKVIEHKAPADIK